MCGCMKQITEAITSAQAAQLAAGQADQVPEASPQPTSSESATAPASSGDSSRILVDTSS